MTAGARPPKRPRPGSDARERVLETAYELFSREGVSAVGVDRVVAEAGVAKMTLYRHFASKEELVLAFLELREERWTREWLEAEMDRLGPDPRTALLGIFDALDAWFRQRDYEGCSFIRTLMDVHDPSAPVHRAAVRHLAVIRGIIEERAREAGVASPEEVAQQLQLLLMGAIVSASRGDRDAARQARGVGELLLDRTLSG